TRRKAGLTARNRVASLGSLLDAQRPELTPLFGMNPPGWAEGQGRGTEGREAEGPPLYAHPDRLRRAEDAARGRAKPFVCGSTSWRRESPLGVAPLHADPCIRHGALLRRNRAGPLLGQNRL